MNQNPLNVLESLGQSVWLDYLHRGDLQNGQFQKWIDEDGVSGATSNPTIFEKAIGESSEYDESIRALAQAGRNMEEIGQAVIVEDIQHAADLFRPTYERLSGADGYVSLEVSPGLAHDTSGTIEEAHRLWDAVNRPNLFIKVPATKEGLPAIQQLLGEGINVNITLLFGLPRYREVTEAYLGGLETLAAQDFPLQRIASVASFFLSRIDSLLDPILQNRRLEGGSMAELVAGLYGQVAIASAKVAYQIYQEVFSSKRFLDLAERGARPQRLLWASTSTKNPEFSDVKYVDALIGRQTINTMPVETLEAYRVHGQPSASLEEGAEDAYRVLEKLREAGIDLDALTQQLEDEGVAKFSKSFDQLNAVLTEKRGAALHEPVHSSKG
jgi:transaldolase